MIAKKENKIYEIGGLERARYVRDGFDIYDDDGQLVEYGAGKTVPYGQYAEAMAMIAELKAELEKAEKPEKAEKTKR